MLLHERLRIEAERREITHEEAADILGVSQATFTRWASGQNLPVARYYTQIARFLKITRPELVAAIRAEREASTPSPRDVALRLDKLDDELSEVKDLLRQLLARPKRR